MMKRRSKLPGLRIQPEMVQRLGRFGALPRQPDETDGHNSPIRAQTLSYEGGGLVTTCATDGEVFVMTSLPVKGNQQPFAVTINRTMLSKVGTVAAQGGSFELRPVRDCVALVQGQRYLAIPSRESFPAFPAPIVTGEAVACDAKWLGSALGFAISGGASGGNPNDEIDSRRLACSIFADGTAMGARNGVNFSVRGPAFGFDVSLRRDHAARLWRFLSLVIQAEKSSTTTRIRHWIEIAKAAVDDREVYRFRHPSSRHILILPSRKTPFLRRALDGLNKKSLTFGVTVEQTPLLKAVGFLQNFGRRLTVRYPHEDSREPALGLSVNDAATHARDAVPSTLIEHAQPLQLPVEFTVSAADFALALRPFRGKTVRINLRSGGHASVTASTDPNTTFTPVGAETFFRASAVEPVIGPVDGWSAT